MLCIQLVDDIPGAEAARLFEGIAAFASVIGFAIEHLKPEVPGGFAVPDVLNFLLINHPESRFFIPRCNAAGSYRSVLCDMEMNPRNHAENIILRQAVL